MIDWVAGIVELMGDWLVGNKRKLGFLFKFLCDLLWIYVAITTQVYGLLIVVVPALFVNGRNFIKWSREKK